MQSEEILELVRNARKKGNFGARALLDIIGPDLAERNIKIGRDRFFDLLNQNNMLVRPKKRFTRTSDSNHHYYKWPNLIQDLNITHPETVWGCDITYIRTRNSFLYLFLVTDLFSRKIMGFHLSHSLMAKGAVKAMKMALERRIYPQRALIHHSDRGIQYCSKMFVDFLQDRSIQISMSEQGNPYQNSIAERINKTLKETFRMGQTFDNYQQALKTLVQGVHNYNTIKPHSSCDKLTPEMAHLRSGPLKKHWKNYRKNTDENGGARRPPNHQAGLSSPG